MAVFCSLVPAHAQSYVTILKPAFDSTGNGSGTFSLNGTEFSVTSGSYRGLGASATGAELNIEVPQQGNDWIYAFAINQTGPTSGTFSGSLTLTEQQIGYLNDGYFQVVVWYSDPFRYDQISGAIEEVPEPSTVALFALGAVGLLKRRHSVV